MNTRSGVYFQFGGWRFSFSRTSVSLHRPNFPKPKSFPSGEIIIIFACSGCPSHNIRFIVFLSCFLSFFLCTRNSKSRVPFFCCCWLVSDRPRYDPAAQRNGRCHSPLRSPRPSRVLSALLVSTGRATGHAHFARLSSNLLRLDTTATRTRRAAASDRNREQRRRTCDHE